MRVFLTVQGEQPMSAATYSIPSGVPSSGAGGLKAEPGGAWGGPGSRKFAPGCPVQCPGQHWTREDGEMGRKYAGFGLRSPPAFGAEGCRLILLEFGSLMAMVVSMGTPEHPGKESSEEGRKMHVQVPEESQHQSCKHELKQKRLICEQDVDKGDQKQNRDGEQEHAGKCREKHKEWREPQGNSRMRCR